MLAGMVGEAAVVFIGLLLVFLVCIDVFLVRKEAKEFEESQEAMDEALDVVHNTLETAYKEAFLSGREDTPEFIVLPTKETYDLLGIHSATYLMALVVRYEAVYGAVNVDKDGNKYEVVVRGKDGRFIPS